MHLVEQLERAPCDERCREGDIPRKSRTSKTLGLRAVERPCVARLFRFGEHILAQETFFEIDLLADELDRMRPSMRVAQRGIKRKPCNHGNDVTVHHPLPRETFDCLFLTHWMAHRSQGRLCHCSIMAQPSLGAMCHFALTSH